MEDDLHVIYLMTPLTPFTVPWSRFFDIHQALPAPLARISSKIGIDERFLLRARMRSPADAAAPHGETSKQDLHAHAQVCRL